jgi:hypothetical protein
MGNSALNHPTGLWDTTAPRGVGWVERSDTHRARREFQSTRYQTLVASRVKSYRQHDPLRWTGQPRNRTTAMVATRRHAVPTCASVVVSSRVFDRRRRHCSCGVGRRTDP